MSNILFVQKKNKKNKKANIILTAIFRKCTIRIKTLYPHPLQNQPASQPNPNGDDCLPSQPQPPTLVPLNKIELSHKKVPLPAAHSGDKSPPPPHSGYESLICQNRWDNGILEGGFYIWRICFSPICFKLIITWFNLR